MGLFNRKKEPENQEDLPELPELPQNQQPQKPGQLPNIEVTDSPPQTPKPLPSSNNIQITPPPATQQQPQQQIETPSIQDQAKVNRGLGLSKIPSYANSAPPIETSKDKRFEPIYIRLDKFETTVQNFNEIKEKVEDIEKLLMKIKEMRSQEEEELEEWEKEIQLIKSRIDYIDRNLLDRFD